MFQMLVCYAWKLCVLGVPIFVVCNFYMLRLMFES